MKMVKQAGRTKSSSTMPEYRFPCYIAPVLVPSDVRATGKGSTDGIEYEYAIGGSLQGLKESPWSEPPHIAFANLRAEDPKAAEAFIKQYGVLDRHCWEREDPDKFKIESAFILEKQDRLRSAWASMSTTGEVPSKGDLGSVIDIEGEVEEGFDTDIVVSGGFVQLRPGDLWASICFLFMWDAQAGKLGFCGNPDCPAPYFRKKRITQKYCEQGPCVQYAQRQYALNWWNRVGKKRRDKKRSKNQRRSKKR